MKKEGEIRGKGDWEEEIRGRGDKGKRREGEKGKRGSVEFSGSRFQVSDNYIVKSKI
ncbi:MAG TPA: hypothetical protein PK521_02245 [Bacteroidales bacterium]|nr:hypothetical protein [Bacteroidales bacterium]